MSLTSPYRALATLLSFQLPGRSYAACVQGNITGLRFESCMAALFGSLVRPRGVRPLRLQGPRPLAECGKVPVGVDAASLNLHDPALKHACTLRVIAPVLCDSVSYVQNHNPLYVYIRNIIPIGV
jgi:hypothetical protein